MKDDKLFVGIDLGTTYCSVAYIDSSGDPVIERNMEGEEETPSAVFFRPQGGYEVGTPAKGKSEMFPEYTVTQVKRRMGKDFSYSIRDKTYTPVEISAMIIRKLLEDFEKTRGVKITDAVVTIPASFGETAREATKSAAQIAGITNVTLLNEPVAAAIAYGYGAKDGGHKRILVYDFGGGTLDVTILDINGTEFTTIAMDGDPGIGGVDFDEEMRKILFEKIATGTGTDYSVLDSDPYLLSDLDIRSERMKIRLSSSEVAEDTVTLNNGTRFTFSVTREEFENAARPMVNETMTCIDNVLAAARCTIDEINTVVLVGGSSRMPMVHEVVSTRYPGARIEIYDSLHAVAKGAALYAGRDTSAPSGTNILSRTFGIKVGNETEGYRISNIIYRNSLLPVNSTGRFRPQEDGQLKVIIEIYESSAFDTDKHTDLSDADPVGQFELELPEAVSVDTPIMVQFNASAEGILTAVAECGSHRESYVLTTAVTMTEEDIDAAREAVDGLAEPGDE